MTSTVILIVKNTEIVKKVDTVNNTNKIYFLETKNRLLIPYLDNFLRSMHHINF